MKFFNSKVKGKHRKEKPGKNDPIIKVVPEVEVREEEPSVTPPPMESGEEEYVSLPSLEDQQIVKVYLPEDLLSQEALRCHKRLANSNNTYVQFVQLLEERERVLKNINALTKKVERLTIDARESETVLESMKFEEQLAAITKEDNDEAEKERETLNHNETYVKKRNEHEKVFELLHRFEIKRLSLQKEIELLHDGVLANLSWAASSTLKLLMAVEARELKSKENHSTSDGEKVEEYEEIFTDITDLVLTAEEELEDLPMVSEGDSLFHLD